MRRSPLKKVSSTGKIKARIQKLLLEKARQRDKVCQLQGVGVKCGGYTTADHIISRFHNATFADMDNIILLCWIHHLRWKPYNATLYADIVRKKIGKKRWDKIHRLAREVRPMSKDDWFSVEERLKRQLV